MTGLGGTLLQEARLEQGLTIEDMVERTKIRADFLQAMEAGDFEKLPDRAYVRPFCAHMLGLWVWRKIRWLWNSMFAAPPPRTSC